MERLNIFAKSPLFHPLPADGAEFQAAFFSFLGCFEAYPVFSGYSVGVVASDGSMVV
jgi:hypothetical protein